MISKISMPLNFFEWHGFVRSYDLRSYDMSSNFKPVDFFLLHRRFSQLQPCCNVIMS